MVYLKIGEKQFSQQYPSSSFHFNMNLLDPNCGTRTPSVFSSRYSLYGSFLNLSESGYYPSSDQQQFIESDHKSITIDGRPLLIVDYSTRLSSTHTYHEKCNDWLRELDKNSS